MTQVSQRDEAGSDSRGTARDAGLSLPGRWISDALAVHEWM